MNTFDSVRVRGALEAASISVSDGISRSDLAQQNSVVYPIDLGSLKVWDSGQPLPATAASDDLALIAGTFGTGTLAISAGDCKAAAVTRYARFEVNLPAEYVAGQAVKLRFSAGMLTTVSDTTAALDCEAYLVGRDSLKSGSDLVTTSATSINSLTFTDIDFIITPTNLVAGDKLDVRIKITCTDGATGTAVKPTIGAIEGIFSIKG